MRGGLWEKEKGTGGGEGVGSSLGMQNEKRKFFLKKIKVNKIITK